jgi:S1-C subfamily serine protease
MSREARLLLVTIVVSVALLFLLARYRFPAQSRGAAPVHVAPLERLAARATFDELASIIGGLEPVITRAVVVMRVLGPDARNPGGAPDVPRFVPALRIRDDIAIAAIDGGARIVGLIGDASASPAIVGQDEARGIIAVRVPKQPAPTLSILSGPVAGAALRYVATVEGTTGGPTVRPLFLGRTDPVTDPRWAVPLLAMGGAPTVEIGSLMFSLDGRLIGLVVRGEGLASLVPASALFEAAEPLARGQSIAAGDLGVSLQPLTPDVASVTKAGYGAVINLVAPDGPAAGRLRAGDVVVAVDGRTIYSTADFRQAEASLRSGATCRVEVMRLGAAATVDLVARVAPATSVRPAEASLGMTLRPAGGRGAEIVRVAPGSGAERSGLSPGDVITLANDVTAPTPAQVRGAFDQLPAGSALLLAVSRGDVHRVVALEKP